jgi:predicted nucleic acid-binding protein
MILIDTCVLARLFEPGDPQHQPAVDAIALLHNRGEVLCICAQNLVELYAIATRDKQGLGLKPSEALAHLHALKSRFVVLPEQPLQEMWESLIQKHQLTNRRVFDLRLACAAIAGHCTAVLTYNDADFPQFAEINVLNPFDILGQPRA